MEFLVSKQSLLLYTWIFKVCVRGSGLDREGNSSIVMITMDRRVEIHVGYSWKDAESSLSKHSL